MNQRCVQCGEHVAMTTGAFRQVIGWEEVRSQGGANKIVDRITTGQVMHRACRTKQANHPGQGTLDWKG